MKKLYFLVMAIFGKQNNLNENLNLNQNFKLNQVGFFNETENLINMLFLEINSLIEKETILIIEDKIVINKAVEKYYPVYKSHRVFKILIYLLFGFILSYFAYWAVKKYLLKREKKEDEDEQLHKNFSGKKEGGLLERQEESQVKLPEQKQYFLYEKDKEVFFSYNGLRSDYDCFLNRLLKYPAFQEKCIQIIKDKGVDGFGMKVIEIDYDQILQKIKDKNLCLVFKNLVSFFQGEEFQQIFSWEFDQKKEKIKKLNRFFINRSIFSGFILFFEAKITEETFESSTNIEDLIEKILDKFPTIDEVKSCEAKYKFDSLIISMVSYFVYKEEDTEFFNYLGSFVYWFFENIKTAYKKSF